MTERRPVTESEKQTILDRDGKFCFVDGHPIESEEDLHFDHIRPIAEGAVPQLKIWLLCAGSTINGKESSPSRNTETNWA